MGVKIENIGVVKSDLPTLLNFTYIEYTNKY